MLRGRVLILSELAADFDAYFGESVAYFDEHTAERSSWHVTIGGRSPRWRS